MTHLTLAALVLAAATSAAPEKAAAPAATESSKPTAAAAKPAKASKEALKDAAASLLGPCSPEMADTTVKAISVIDGRAMNAILDGQGSKASRADPAALFLVVEYETAKGPDRDYRQITTAFHLTTAQAQALVGEKMCAFAKSL